MSYLIFYIPDPIITVTVEPPPTITVNYSQIIQSSGGSSSGSNSRVFNFVDADLDVNGNITFYHNLDKTYVDYSVYMPNVGEIFADSDSYLFNAVTVNLKSFRPLVGMWTILIEV